VAAAARVLAPDGPKPLLQASHVMVRFKMVELLAEWVAGLALTHDSISSCKVSGCVDRG